MAQVTSLQFHEQVLRNLLQIGDDRMIQLSFDKGKGIENHRTNHHAVLIVLAGKLQFFLDQQNFEISAFEMIEIEPLRLHSFVAIEPTVVLLCLFTGSASDDTVAKMNDRQTATRAADDLIFNS